MAGQQELSIDLASRWAELSAKNPKTRIRNAAKELNVSEVELLATKCDGEEVIRLRPEFTNILKEAESLGYVMALTRNDSVVHERKGVYSNFGSHGSSMALFVNPDIDLRVFLSCWGSAFAVKEDVKGKQRFSLQFFSTWGMAIHKIYLNAKSDHQAFESIVSKYRSENQSSEQTIEDQIIKPKAQKGEEKDVEGFQESWINLNDTHDFYMLLGKHNMTRLRALEMAPKAENQFFHSYAFQVENDTIKKVFAEAVESETPIMVFVGNQGMLQIHTGQISNLMQYEQWYNVMDKEFNLHLNEENIFQSWLVFKPTKDGLVCSLEVFDKNEEMMIQVFGKRKPGIPEDENWRNIIKKHV